MTIVELGIWDRILPVPDDVEKYGVLTDADLLTDVFIYGDVPAPLAAGCQATYTGPLADCDAVIYGHVDDDAAVYLARFAIRQTGRIVRVEHRTVLFTRNSIEGIAEPRAPWWASPVDPSTPGAVPVTVVMFEEES